MTITNQLNNLVADILTLKYYFATKTVLGCCCKKRKDLKDLRNLSREISISIYLISSRLMTNHQDHWEQ